MSQVMTYGTVIVVLLMAFTVLGLGLPGLLHRSSVIGGIEWNDRGPTPLREKRYTPQGMTWANGRIVFANSWKDTRSRVYEINPSTMEVTRYFDMPKDAVHTSGLAWDERYLWGVDYRSNKAYCLDLNASMEKGVAKVIGSFHTTLRGTSACCILTWHGVKYLAISDFMRSQKTIFVRHEEAIKTGSAKGFIDFKYTNGGFSQGLEFIEGYIFEAENRLGVDVINKIDLELLEISATSNAATIMQYAAPSRGVEDLAWGDDYLWTSDESSFRFYRGVVETGRE